MYQQHACVNSMHVSTRTCTHTRTTNAPKTPPTNRQPQGVIGPGGVQWMTAGRGVVHSEMPVVETGLLHGFQLWCGRGAACCVR